MSKMTTEASLTAGFRPHAGIPDKYTRIIDLLPALSLPLLDNESGSLGFSNMKKKNMLDSG